MNTLPAFREPSSANLDHSARRREEERRPITPHVLPSKNRSSLVNHGVCGAEAAGSPDVKLLIFIGINVGGAAGWWLGEYLGPTTAFFASGAGSLLGVFGGWWLARRFLV